MSSLLIHWHDDEEKQLYISVEFIFGAYSIVSVEGQQKRRAVPVIKREFMQIVSGRAGRVCIAGFEAYSEGTYPLQSSDICAVQSAILPDFVGPVQLFSVHAVQYVPSPAVRVCQHGSEVRAASLLRF